MRALAPPMSRTGGSRRPSVVIVGGGVTGLTAAHAIHRERPDVELHVFEARERLGGNIATERHEGFVIDTGPDSFLRTKPDAVDLCRELGLETELVPTREAARHVFVAHHGKLELMPGGMALAVPTRIGPLLETPLLSAVGKMRLLAEPIVPRSRSLGEDESIESFFTRRLGSEGARRLAAPLLGGIYAGDVSKLSIQATFPQLVELEARHGSLLRGFLALELARNKAAEGQASPTLGDVYAWLRRAGAAQAPSPFLSLRSGMGSLIDALARSLPSGVAQTDSPVTQIDRTEHGFRVEVNGGEVFEADSVILAAQAHVAATLAPDAELARDLGGIPYVSTATVFFALDPRAVAHTLEGFGFIVPEGEAEILASTWVSSKWDGRAPGGMALVRAFVGGARDPLRVASSTDAELVSLAKSELERLMGTLGTPHFTRVYRYIGAGPQPHVGHNARLARIAARLHEIPGLHVAGAAYGGVGIPDCVRQARAVARAVLEGLAAGTRPSNQDNSAALS
jgi:oxygen-dependent protoporphyrinogen oxidase